jgi:hypothetical protein
MQWLGFFRTVTSRIGQIVDHAIGRKKNETYEIAAPPFAPKFSGVSRGRVGTRGVTAQRNRVSRWRAHNQSARSARRAQRKSEAYAP